MKLIYLYILGISILLFSSCTRYCYIPRHNIIFGISDKKKEVKPIQKEENKIQDIRLVDEEIIDENAQDKLEITENELIEQEETVLMLNKNHITAIAKSDKNTFNKISKNLSNPLTKLVYEKVIKKNQIFQKQKHLPEDEPADERKFSYASLISMIMGILGIVLLVLAFLSDFLVEFYLYQEVLFVASIFLAISAIVLGIIALATTKKDKETYKNRYMSAIGMVLGGLEVFGIILIVVALLAIFGI